MACNCLNELEDRISEDFNKKNPGTTIKESYFTNGAWIQRGLKDGKVIMPLELTAPHLIKYAILSKKGKEINKKSEVSVCFKYCPFCGKKLEGEE